jgi:hypothetical protein
MLLVRAICVGLLPDGLVIANAAGARIPSKLIRNPYSGFAIGSSFIDLKDNLSIEARTLIALAVLFSFAVTSVLDAPLSKSVRNRMSSSELQGRLFRIISPSPSARVHLQV